MSDMNEMTRRATQWAHDAGILPDNKPLVQYRVIKRELKELADEIQKLDGKFGKPEDLKKEIADVFFSLNCFAETMKYNLLECLELKMPILESRLEGGKLIDGVFVKEEDLNGR